MCLYDNTPRNNKATVILPNVATKAERYRFFNIEFKKLKKIFFDKNRIYFHFIQTTKGWIARKTKRQNAHHLLNHLNFSIKEL